MAVHVERDGAVAVVTLDHPPVNALSEALLRRLDDVLGELEDDASARVVVLAGAGTKGFSAGADVTEFERFRATGAFPLPAVLPRLAGLPQPVVARLHGHCLGGGLELALACDLRVAAEDARLGFPEIRLGIVPGAGGTQLLPRLVGRGRALLLELTGEPVDARRAYACGLVDVLAPTAELDATVRALAARIAAQPRAAVAAYKRLARAAAELPLAAGIARESEEFAACVAGEDAREGVRAFLERREPRWTA